MPRKRMITPEIWRDGGMIRLPRDARQLFIGMITLADDEGYGNADLLELRISIFPADNDITNKMIGEWLANMEANGMAEFSRNGDRSYYRLPGWAKHQSIRSDWKKPSSIKSMFGTATGLDTDMYTAPDTVLDHNELTNKVNKEKESAAPPRSSANKKSKGKVYEIVQVHLAQKMGKAPSEKVVWWIINKCKNKLDPIELIEYAYSDGIKKPEAIITDAGNHPDKYADRIMGWQGFIVAHKLDKKQIQTAGQILAGITERATAEGG